MLQPYLKIWDSDWIFGRAVTAIFSLGVHSPCLKRSHCRIYWKDFGSTVQKTGFLQRNEMLLPRVLWLTWDLIYRKLGLLLLLSRSLGLRLLKGFLGLLFIQKQITKMDSPYQIRSKMLHSTKVIIFISWHSKKYVFIMKDPWCIG